MFPWGKGIIAASPVIMKNDSVGGFCSSGLSNAEKIIKETYQRERGFNESFIKRWLEFRVIAYPDWGFVMKIPLDYKLHYQFISRIGYLDAQRVMPDQTCDFKLLPAIKEVPIYDECGDRIQEFIVQSKGKDTIEVIERLLERDSVEDAVDIIRQKPAVEDIILTKGGLLWDNFFYNTVVSGENILKCIDLSFFTTNVFNQLRVIQVLDITDIYYTDRHVTLNSIKNKFGYVTCDDLLELKKLDNHFNLKGRLESEYREALSIPFDLDMSELKISKQDINFYECPIKEALVMLTRNKDVRTMNGARFKDIYFSDREGFKSFRNVVFSVVNRHRHDSMLREFAEKRINIHSKILMSASPLSKLNIVALEVAMSSSVRKYDSRLINLIPEDSLLHINEMVETINPARQNIVVLAPGGMSDIALIFMATDANGIVIFCLDPFKSQYSEMSETAAHYYSTSKLTYGAMRWQEYLSLKNRGYGVEAFLRYELGEMKAKNIKITNLDKKIFHIDFDWEYYQEKLRPRFVIFIQETIINFYEDVHGQYKRLFNEYLGKLADILVFKTETLAAFLFQLKRYIVKDFLAIISFANSLTDVKIGTFNEGFTSYWEAFMLEKLGLDNKVENLAEKVGIERKKLFPEIRWGPDGFCPMLYRIKSIEPFSYRRNRIKRQCNSPLNFRYKSRLMGFIAAILLSVFLSFPFNVFAKSNPIEGCYIVGRGRVLEENPQTVREDKIVIDNEVKKEGKVREKNSINSFRNEYEGIIITLFSSLLMGVFVWLIGSWKVSVILGVGWAGMHFLGRWQCSGHRQSMQRLFDKNILESGVESKVGKFVTKRDWDLRTIIFIGIVTAAFCIWLYHCWRNPLFYIGIIVCGVVIYKVYRWMVRFYHPASVNIRKIASWQNPRRQKKIYNLLTKCEKRRKRDLKKKYRIREFIQKWDLKQKAAFMVILAIAFCLRVGEKSFFILLALLGLLNLISMGIIIRNFKIEKDGFGKSVSNWDLQKIIFIGILSIMFYCLGNKLLFAFITYLLGLSLIDKLIIINKISEVERKTKARVFMGKWDLRKIVMGSGMIGLFLYGCTEARFYLLLGIVIAAIISYVLIAALVDNLCSKINEWYEKLNEKAASDKSIWGKIISNKQVLIRVAKYISVVIVSIAIFIWVLTVEKYSGLIAAGLFVLCIFCGDKPDRLYEPKRPLLQVPLKSKRLKFGIVSENEKNENDEKTNARIRFLRCLAAISKGTRLLIGLGNVLEIKEVLDKIKIISWQKDLEDICKRWEHNPLILKAAAQWRREQRDALLCLKALKQKANTAKNASQIRYLLREVREYMFNRKSKVRRTAYKITQELEWREMALSGEEDRWAGRHIKIVTSEYTYFWVSFVIIGIVLIGILLFFGKDIFEFYIIISLFVILGILTLFMEINMIQKIFKKIRSGLMWKTIKDRTDNKLQQKILRKIFTYDNIFDFFKKTFIIFLTAGLIGWVVKKIFVIIVDLSLWVFRKINRRLDVLADKISKGIGIEEQLRSLFGLENKSNDSSSSSLKSRNAYLRLNEMPLYHFFCSSLAGRSPPLEQCRANYIEHLLLFSIIPCIVFFTSLFILSLVYIIDHRNWRQVPKEEAAFLPVAVGAFSPAAFISVNGDGSQRSSPMAYKELQPYHLINSVTTASPVNLNGKKTPRLDLEELLAPELKLMELLFSLPQWEMDEVVKRKYFPEIGSSFPLEYLQKTYVSWWGANIATLAFVIILASFLRVLKEDRRFSDREIKSYIDNRYIHWGDLNMNFENSCVGIYCREISPSLVEIFQALCRFWESYWENNQPYYYLQSRFKLVDLPFPWPWGISAIELIYKMLSRWAFYHKRSRKPIGDYLKYLEDVLGVPLSKFGFMTDFSQEVISTDLSKVDRPFYFSGYVKAAKYDRGPKASDRRLRSLEQILANKAIALSQVSCQHLATYDDTGYIIYVPSKNMVGFYPQDVLSSYDKEKIERLPFILRGIACRGGRNILNDSDYLRYLYPQFYNELIAVTGLVLIEEFREILPQYSQETIHKIFYVLNEAGIIEIIKPSIGNPETAFVPLKIFTSANTLRDLFYSELSEVADDYELIKAILEGSRIIPIGTFYKLSASVESRKEIIGEARTREIPVVEIGEEGLSRIVCSPVRHEAIFRNSHRPMQVTASIKAIRKIGRDCSSPIQQSGLEVWDIICNKGKISITENSLSPQKCSSPLGRIQKVKDGKNRQVLIDPTPISKKDRRIWRENSERHFLIQWIKDKLPYGYQPFDEEIRMLAKKVNRSEAETKERVLMLAFIRDNFLELSDKKLSEILNCKECSINLRLRWFGYSRWVRQGRERQMLWHSFLAGEIGDVLELADDFGKPRGYMVDLFDQYRNICQHYIVDDLEVLYNACGYKEGVCELQRMQLMSLINEEVGLHRWTAREEAEMLKRRTEDPISLAIEYGKTPLAVKEKIKEIDFIVDNYQKLSLGQLGQQLELNRREILVKLRALGLVENILSVVEEEDELRLIEEFISEQVKDKKKLLINRLFHKILHQDKGGVFAHDFAGKKRRERIWRRILTIYFGAEDKIKKMKIGGQQFTQEYLEGLGDVVIEGRLESEARKAILNIGGIKREFLGYSGSKYEMLVGAGGIPVAVFMFKSYSAYEFFPIIDMGLGKPLDIEDDTMFHPGQMSPEKYNSLELVGTFKRLGAEGSLSLGGKYRRLMDGTSMQARKAHKAKFSDRYGYEKVFIVFGKALFGGVIACCVSAENIGDKALNEPFTRSFLIAAGTYVASVRGYIKFSSEFDLLNGEYELHGYPVDSRGLIILRVCETGETFREEVYLSKGCAGKRAHVYICNSGGKAHIAGARAVDKKTGKIVHRELAIVYEAKDRLADSFETGNIIGTFMRWRKGLECGDVYIVERIQVEDGGIIYVEGKLRGFELLTGLPVKIKVIDKDIYVRVLDDNGGLLKDIYGKDLVIQVEKGDKNIAQKVREQILEKVPLCYILCRQAKVLFEQGKEEEAFQLFQRALRLRVAQVKVRDTRQLEGQHEQLKLELGGAVDTLRDNLHLSPEKELIDSVYMKIKGSKAPQHNSAPQERQIWNVEREMVLIEYIEKRVKFGCLPKKWHVDRMVKLVNAGQKDIYISIEEVSQRAELLCVIRNGYFSPEMNYAELADLTGLTEEEVKKRVEWFNYSEWTADSRIELWQRYNRGIKSREIPAVAEEFRKPKEMLTQMLCLYQDISEVFFDWGLDALCRVRPEPEEFLRDLIVKELNLHPWTAEERITAFEKRKEDTFNLAVELGKSRYVVLKTITEYMESKIRKHIGYPDKNLEEEGVLDGKKTRYSFTVDARKRGEINVSGQRIVFCVSDEYTITNFSVDIDARLKIRNIYYESYNNRPLGFYLVTGYVTGELLAVLVGSQIDQVGFLEELSRDKLIVIKGVNIQGVHYSGFGVVVIGKKPYRVADKENIGSKGDILVDNAIPIYVLGEEVRPAVWRDEHGRAYHSGKGDINVKELRDRGSIDMLRTDSFGHAHIGKRWSLAERETYVSAVYIKDRKGQLVILRSDDWGQDTIDAGVFYNNYIIEIEPCARPLVTVKPDRKPQYSYVFKIRWDSAGVVPEVSSRRIIREEWRGPGIFTQLRVCSRTVSFAGLNLRFPKELNGCKAIAEVFDKEGRVEIFAAPGVSVGRGKFRIINGVAEVEEFEFYKKDGVWGKELVKMGKSLEEAQTEKNEAVYLLSRGKYVQVLDKLKKAESLLAGVSEQLKEEITLEIDKIKIVCLERIDLLRKADVLLKQGDTLGAERKPQEALVLFKKVKEMISWVDDGVSLFSSSSTVESRSIEELVGKFYLLDKALDLLSQGKLEEFSEAAKRLGFDDTMSQEREVLTKANQGIEQYGQQLKKKKAPQGRRTWDPAREKSLIKYIKKKIPFGLLPSAEDIGRMEKLVNTTSRVKSIEEIWERAIVLAVIRNRYFDPEITNEDLAVLVRWSKNAVKKRLRWFKYSQWSREGRLKLWQLYQEGIKDEDIPAIANDFGKPPEVLAQALKIFKNISEVYFDYGLSVLSDVCNSVSLRFLRRLTNEDLRLSPWKKKQEAEVFQRRNEDAAKLAEEFGKTRKVILKKIDEVYEDMVAKYIERERNDPVKREIACLHHNILPANNGGKYAHDDEVSRRRDWERILALSFGGKRKIVWAEKKRTKVEHVVIRGQMPPKSAKLCIRGKYLGEFHNYKGFKYEIEMVDYDRPVRIFFLRNPLKSVPSIRDYSAFEFFNVFDIKTGEPLKIEGRDFFYRGAIHRTMLDNFEFVVICGRLVKAGSLNLAGKPFIDGSLEFKGKEASQRLTAKFGPMHSYEGVYVAIGRGKRVFWKCVSAENIGEGSLNALFMRSFQVSEENFVGFAYGNVYIDEFNLLGKDFMLCDCLLDKGGGFSKSDENKTRVISIDFGPDCGEKYARVSDIR
ncbi:MAG: hypothetical protein JSV34_03275, partial [Candidatus Omnitrophota bacterium]